MTAESRISVATHPDINLRVKLKPLDFEFASQGTFALVTGDVHVQFDEIPVTVAIPFLGRRVVAGSVGPFGVHLKPFEAQFRAIGLDTRGVIGRNDAEFGLHATGDCKAEVDISGELSDRILSATIETIIEE